MRKRSPARRPSTRWLGSSSVWSPELGKCSAGTVSIDDRSITESLKLRAGVSGRTSSRMLWTISSGVSAPEVLVPGRSASV